MGSQAPDFRLPESSMWVRARLERGPQQRLAGDDRRHQGRRDGHDDLHLHLREPASERPDLGQARFRTPRPGPRAAVPRPQTAPAEASWPDGPRD
jgi:hypothetical protein